MCLTREGNSKDKDQRRPGKRIPVPVMEAHLATTLSCSRKVLYETLLKKDQIF